MLSANPSCPVVRRDGRAAFVSAKTAGRRRVGFPRQCQRSSFAGRASAYSPDPDDAAGPRIRRVRVPRPRTSTGGIVRQPQDLQQLMDVLSSGVAVEDPEDFLKLLATAPRVMERRPGPGASAPDRYRPFQQQQQQFWQQQQQQQQEMLQQQRRLAAAEAEEARRRAALEQQQRQEEQEQRREALRAAMLQNARRHLPRYDAPSLARLASGLAAAGVRDPALCDEMVRQIMAQQQQTQQQPYTGQSQQPQERGAPPSRSLADLLDAFAAMRHRPSDAQLAELLRLQAQQQQLQEQQQQQQQRAAEIARLRQQQQQQQQQQQLRLQPRGMGAAAQPAAAATGSASGSPGRYGSGTSPVVDDVSPEDAARLLLALSRLGYTPDQATLEGLLEQLQPQRLQLQPQPQPQQTAEPELQNRRATAAAVPPQQQSDPRVSRAVTPAAGALSATEVPAAPAASRTLGGAAASPASEQQLKGFAPVDVDGQREQEEEEEEDYNERLSYSLQRDAQAVASAVRALERMGRLAEAQQLRQRFLRHVQEVQQRDVVERRTGRQQEQAAAAAAAEQQRLAAAVAGAAAAERERQRQAEMLRERQAAAAAAAAELQARKQQRQQLGQPRPEDQATALRAQLSRKLRTADTWQQIRVLLVTYQEALDFDCVTSAATRLAELLAATRRPGRGYGLRERGELGDLLEGLGELALQRLKGASAAQAASLLTSVVRMRYLEERLMVGLLRRLRDTLDEAGGGELAAVLTALAQCGLRPSAPWMETFLLRCQDLLEEFSPEDLALLPVCLAQLGAHPGRSWLGSYLDVLQEREAELSPSTVSEAVRSVALLDRQFLAAWRQAAAVRQQQQQAQTQAEAQARAEAAAAEQRQQQQQLPHETQASSALASVDEVLSLAEFKRPGAEAADAAEADAEAALQLPPLHPKQREMMEAASAAAATEHDEERQQQQQKQGSAQPPPAMPFAGATQSIELDVDSADVPYGDGPASVLSQPASSSPQEPTADDLQPDSAAAAVSFATAAAEGAAAPPAAAVPPRGSRQLPGSYSIDGYYSPTAYGEYDDQYTPEDDDQWEEGEQEEGEEGDELEEEAQPAVASLEGSGLILDESVAEAMAEARLQGKEAAVQAEPAGASTVPGQETKAPSVSPRIQTDEAQSSMPQTRQPLQQQAPAQASQTPPPSQSSPPPPQQQQQQQLQAGPGGLSGSRISINLKPGMEAAASPSGRQPPQQPQPQQRPEQQSAAAGRQVEVPEWQDASRDRKPSQAGEQKKVAKGTSGPGAPIYQQGGQTDTQQPKAGGPKVHQDAQPSAQSKPSVRPEELAQARALRSLLLERYEAVAAFKEEVEARQRFGAEGGEPEDDEPPAFSELEAALAAQYLAAREQLQRLQADFDNVKRRAGVELVQATAQAKAEVLKPLLNIADNFERAATQIKPKTDGERAVHEAYQAVYAELRQFLKQQGLQEVGAEGDTFDPNLHEAVMREERDDVPDGFITMVFQKGYRLGDLLIRPAYVKVAFS